MEIAVITPINACRRLARKYRVATKSSKRMGKKLSAFSRQLSAQADYICPDLVGRRPLMRAGETDDLSTTPCSPADALSSFVAQ
jgi:hypothetical protein